LYSAAAGPWDACLVFTFTGVGGRGGDGDGRGDGGQGLRSYQFRSELVRRNEVPMIHWLQSLAAFVCGGCLAMSMALWKQSRRSDERRVKRLLIVSSQATKERMIFVNLGGDQLFWLSRMMNGEIFDDGRLRFIVEYEPVPPKRRPFAIIILAARVLWSNPMRWFPLRGKGRTDLK
jgi:hypothetical protein